MDTLAIQKELAGWMCKEYLAPPGKYRVLMWDWWEVSSSGYTLEEALTPAVIREFDDAEEALRFARSQPSNQGYDEYSVYDEYGRYLGGNRESRGPRPSPVIPKTPAPFTDRLTEAFSEAFRLHATQLRKGTKIPYVSHLMAVASLVIENGGDEDEAIAALLHDAAEDQGGRATLEKIRQRFGPRVAEIVDGCTDTYEYPKPEWKERKKKFLERLAGASPSVRLVAAADKLHNARAMLADYRAIGSLLWYRFNAPKEGLLWYHRAVTETLKQAGTSSLVEELDRVVTELERLTSKG
jgi:hypothetical protein